MSMFKNPGDYMMSFGKHKGLTVKDVAVKDPGYFDYMLRQDWFCEHKSGLATAIVAYIRTHNIPCPAIEVGVADKQSLESV